MCKTLSLIKMFKNGPFYTKNIIENNENIQIKKIFLHKKNMLGGSSKNHVFLTHLSYLSYFLCLMPEVVTGSFLTKVKDTPITSW